MRNNLLSFSPAEDFLYKAENLKGRSEILYCTERNFKTCFVKWI